MALEIEIIPVTLSGRVGLQGAVGGLPLVVRVEAVIRVSNRSTRSPTAWHLARTLTFEAQLLLVVEKGGKIGRSSVVDAIAIVSGGFAVAC